MGTVYLTATLSILSPFQGSHQAAEGRDAVEDANTAPKPRKVADGQANTEGEDGAEQAGRDEEERHAGPERPRAWAEVLLIDDFHRRVGPEREACDHQAGQGEVQCQKAEGFAPVNQPAKSAEKAAALSVSMVDIYFASKSVSR